MPSTKRGVYHNLKESEYAVSNGEIAFFFSSRVYQNKFIQEYEQHREKFNRKLINTISPNIKLNLHVLADISLYEMIEKRGFRACFKQAQMSWYDLTKGVDISWQDLQNYALRKMTEPHTQSWLKIQKPKLSERLKIMV